MILRQAVTADPIAEFAAEVREGLLRPGQKELPSKYLYDEVGSALFEVISALPEYGLTRADERLLRENSAEIVGHLKSPLVVAELGSGSGKKTRYLLEALDSGRRTRYCPIEISHAALTMVARELGDIEHISIVGFEREYLDGLLEVADNRLPGEQLLVLFLGSTIGNFDRPADVKFLRAVRRILQPGDALLLGTDLVKPTPQMLDAYDDSLGVTAAFNLNLLGRINRELGGNFVLSQFAHEARFNPETRSIEMHLRSERNQNVTISRAGLTVTFRAGETIWTESSHKYSRPELLQLAMAASFRWKQQWMDHEWPFAETLLIAE
ncbi:MAG TPA: L-histidine N(alpha)-methyltransferase [Terriglobales bacterium]|jgi:L-histidine N-alpha-methyltransferase|nr:L-histidine N(alpha)-methyltransferase [Terriglobales bacterium]